MKTYHVYILPFLHSARIDSRIGSTNEAVKIKLSEVNGSLCSKAANPYIRHRHDSDPAPTRQRGDTSDATQKLAYSIN